MAGNAIIGALRVVLGADTAALESGLKDAQSSLSNFSAGAGLALAGVATAIAAAAVAIGAHVKSTIDSADKMGKAAQSAGMSIGEFSKLAYAASLSDVEIEGLGKSLGKLDKAMSATAGGAGGPTADAFKALGITVTDSNGKLKSAGDVLTEVAGKFKWYEDSAAKTALAIAIFGKAGAAMIPLLNQGALGIKEAGDEAERFGLVLDGKTTAAAEAFNDNLKRMSAITEGMWIQVTAKMLPALESLSNVFLENKQNSALLSAMADGLTTALRAAISVTVQGIVIFGRLGAELSALWKVLELGASTNWIFNMKAWNDMQAAFSAFTAEGEKTDVALKSLSTTVDNFWKTGTTSTESWTVQAAAVRQMNREVVAIGESWAKTSAPIITATNQAKSAIQSYTDGVEKRIAGMQAEAQTIGMSAFQTDALKVKLQGLAVAAAAHIPITAQLSESMTALGLKLATAAEKAGFAKTVYEQTRTPAEQYGATIEQLNGALDRGAISQDTYARAVAQAQDKLTQANPAAQAFGQSLETAFGKAIDGGTKFSDILRGLLKDLLKAFASQAFKMLLYGNAGAGGSFGGLLSSIFSSFGGGKATGGPVSSSRAYMVGENGPEMFRPNTSGQIVPNHELGNGGVGVSVPIHVTIDARGADQAAVVRIGQSLDELKRTLPRRIGAVTTAQQVRKTRY